MTKDIMLISQLKIRLYINLFVISINFIQISALEKVALIGIPKSGNHLLSKVVNLLYGEKFSVNTEIDCGAFLCLKERLDKTILTTHLAYTHDNIRQLKENGYNKLIIIYRDPRDVLISSWVSDSDLYPFNQRLLLLINNYNAFYPKVNKKHPYYKTFKNIDTAFRKAYLPWTKVRQVYKTTYEKLVGKNGGGNDDVQLDELKNIASYLNLNYTEEELKTISKKIYGGTITFKQGQIGTWKKYFNSEHKKNFKKIAGYLLVDLGYEKDFNW